MDKQKKSAIIAISVVIPLTSFLVWNSDQSEQVIESTYKEKMIAVTSFYPLYEFTKQVGGEKAEVILLVPFGVEPHDWEPTINDIQKIQQADLIVINGIGFEKWINDRDFRTEALIVDTSSDIHLDESDKIFHDPHIWLNPVMAQKQVKNIASAFSRIDPQNSEYYVKNSDSYISELDKLDKKIIDELSKCNKKNFITFHNAFSYFSFQYGLNQHTINLSDPNSEPTAKTLEKIIELAKNLDIDIIFSEEGVDSRTSQVIANEINGRVLLLSTLEISEINSNYIQKMEQNLSLLKEALCN